MKTNLFVLIILVSFIACGQDKEFNPGDSVRSPSRDGRLTGKIDVSSYQRLSLSDSKSKLSVKLIGLDGQQVTQLSDLKPNTTYKVKLQSLGANLVELRSAFGFDVLEKKENVVDGAFTADYTIKTSHDVNEPLFISFLPLIQSEGRISRRELAQNFFLPEN